MVPCGAAGGPAVDQLSFIDLLYAVPVGDLAMRVSGAKLHQISTADWSALALILAVIVLSWIGLHKNRAVMADDERIHRSIGDIQFRSMRFVQFMVEIVIVGMYFTMGLTLKLPTTSRSPGPLPSESWLTGLLLCIFAAYLTWDLIDTQQARSNAEKHRAHHHPGHQPPFDWPTRAASGIVVTLVFALLPSDLRRRAPGTGARRSAPGGTEHRPADHPLRLPLRAGSMGQYPNVQAQVGAEKTAFGGRQFVTVGRGAWRSGKDRVPASPTRPGWDAVFGRPACSGGLPGCAGTATHQLLLAVLGAAQHRHTRRSSDCRADGSSPPSGSYHRSVEELTPLRGDLRTAFPLAAASLATVLRPASWRWFSSSAVTNYALTPQAWRSIVTGAAPYQGVRPARSVRWTARGACPRFARGRSRRGVNCGIGVVDAMALRAAG